MLITCLFILSTIDGLAQDTLDILFVGNSFTFFWNVPQVVSALAEYKGLVYRCRSSTAGGANWEQHWKGEKDLETTRKIEEGAWDYVVLQNQSSSAIDRPVQFDEYGGKLIELIKSNGAEPLLFTTWSYESNRKMQDPITRGYQKLADQHQIKTVPVGPVWDEVRAKYPALDLYSDDKHQSPLGTYLIGLTFFRQISGLDISEMPSRLQTKDQIGEVIHLLFLNNTESEKVRSAVQAHVF